METYNIAPNNTLKIYGPGNFQFYGANSLLSIKAVRVPFERKEEDIRVRVSYKNIYGHSFSFPVTLYSPYFFMAVTPDFSDMPEAGKTAYSWVEIINEENFDLTVSISLNTNLHTNLNNFHHKRDE